MVATCLIEPFLSILCHGPEQSALHTPGKLELTCVGNRILHPSDTLLRTWCLNAPRLFVTDEGEEISTLSRSCCESASTDERQIKASPDIHNT